MILVGLRDFSGMFFPTWQAWDMSTPVAMMGDPEAALPSELECLENLRWWVEGDSPFVRFFVRCPSPIAPPSLRAFKDASNFNWGRV